MEIERGLTLEHPTICPSDLSTLAALLAGAQLFIGNDSGPGHIAAAGGTPTLSLFGPTDPGIWSPRHPRGRMLHMANITDIPIAAVMNAAQEMLEETRGG